MYAIGGNKSRRQTRGFAPSKHLCSFTWTVFSPHEATWKQKVEEGKRVFTGLKKIIFKKKNKCSGPNDVRMWRRRPLLPLVLTGRQAGSSGGGVVGEVRAIQTSLSAASRPLFLAIYSSLLGALTKSHVCRQDEYKSSGLLESLANCKVHHCQLQ